MTYFTYIINTLFATLSLLIASGVAIHDGHFGHAIDISLTHAKAQFARFTNHQRVANAAHPFRT